MGASNSKSSSRIESTSYHKIVSKRDSKHRNVVYTHPSDSVTRPTTSSHVNESKDLSKNVSNVSSSVSSCMDSSELSYAGDSFYEFPKSDLARYSSRQNHHQSSVTTSSWASWPQNDSTALSVQNAANCSHSFDTKGKVTETCVSSPSSTCGGSRQLSDSKGAANDSPRKENVGFDENQSWDHVSPNLPVKVFVFGGNAASSPSLQPSQISSSTANPVILHEDMGHVPQETSTGNIILQEEKLQSFSNDGSPHVQVSNEPPVLVNNSSDPAWKLVSETLAAAFNTKSSPAEFYTSMSVVLDMFANYALQQHSISPVPSAENCVKSLSILLRILSCPSVRQNVGTQTDHVLSDLRQQSTDPTLKKNVDDGDAVKWHDTDKVQHTSTRDDASYALESERFHSRPDSNADKSESSSGTTSSLSVRSSSLMSLTSSDLCRRDGDPDFEYVCGECGDKVSLFNGDLSLSWDRHCQKPCHLLAVKPEKKENPISVQQHCRELAKEDIGTIQEATKQEKKTLKWAQSQIIKMKEDMNVKFSSYNRVKCVLCGVLASSPMNMIDHLNGKSHQQKKDAKVDGEKISEKTDIVPKKAVSKDKLCTNWINIRGGGLLSIEILLKIFSPYGTVTYVRAASKKACAAIQFQLSQSVLYLEDLRVVRYRTLELVVSKLSEDEVPNTKGCDNPSAVSLSLPNTLTSMFSSKMEFLSTLRQLSQDAQDAQKGSEVIQLCRKVETLLRSRYPNCRAYPFGSRAAGLATSKSDIDIYFDTGDTYYGTAFQDEMDQLHICDTVYRVLSKSNDFSSIMKVPGARVPIVKFIHKETLLACDVSFRSGLGHRNTQLIRFLMELDGRVRPLLLLTKKWLRCCNIPAGKRGLTSYALTLMLVFYLQIIPEPVLPSVMYLIENVPQCSGVFVCGWNCSIPKQSANIFTSSNKYEISDLLRGFFTFYGSFDFSQRVVCPLVGKSVDRKLFSPKPQLLPPFTKPLLSYYLTCTWTDEAPLFQNGKPMCVQDPFELCHNVAKGVPSFLMVKFQAMCRESQKLLAKWNLPEDIALHAPPGLPFAYSD